MALRNVRPIPVPSSIFHPISFPSPGFSFRQLTREKKNTDVESDQESWTGIAAAADIEREHEYSDEEQLATVTVVEDFDPSVLRHYSTNPDAEQRQRQQRPLLTPQPLPPPPRSLSREKASRSDGGSVAKNLNVKVRYETKAARKATRATQRARRTEKAERAGGKAARKKAGGGGGGGKKSRARKK